MSNGRNHNSGNRRQNALTEFEQKYKGEILAFKHTKELPELLSALQEFVNNKMKPISPTQMRNIYNDIIQRKSHQAIQLSRPFLAYTAGRANEVKPIVKLFDETIKQIDSHEKLENFHSFMEAVISYHRYYHGT